MQKSVLGGGSTKKIDHKCDQAPIKSSWDLYRVYRY